MRVPPKVALIVGLVCCAAGIAQQVTPLPDVSPAVEAYRRMWNALTPEQQKQTVQRGGFTPEQYEQALKGKAATPATPKATTGTPDYNKGADAGALDALGGSLRDLNAIRDGNVQRLQKDGCPPEIAVRIADLKGKLQAEQAELKALSGGGASSTAGRAPAADPMDLAQSWFQNTATDAARPAEARSEPDRLLDSVLPTGAAPSPGPELGARRSLTAEISRMQTELDRLQGACIPVKR